MSDDYTGLAEVGRDKDGVYLLLGNQRLLWAGVPEAIASLANLISCFEALPPPPKSKKDGAS